MSPEALQNSLAERIGTLADKCDNMTAASLMPLPAETHLQFARICLTDMRDELRRIYECMTGDNPWADELPSLSKPVEPKK